MTQPKAELERLTTDGFNASTVEHLHRYAVAATLCRGRDVLDIASGEGYGSNLLAQSARSVIGVDIAGDAVAHARSKYALPNLEFVQAAVHSVPLRNASIDVVVSFETLEHHDRHEEMMAEVKRVLRPDGLLIISTPEKLFYSDIPGYQNIYHVKELYLSEFRSLLGRYFVRHKLLFQSLSYGTFVLPEDDLGALTYFAGGFDGVASCTALPKPEFNIALASDGELPAVSASFFDGSLALRDNLRQGRETVPHLQRLLASHEQVMDDLTHSWSFRLARAMTWPVRKLLGRA